MMSSISEGEKSYIVEGIKAGLRNDGRSPDQYREITLETGILQTASGSARCLVGLTDVIVSVKADVGRPLLSAPEQGNLEYGVEFSPCVMQGRQAEDIAKELACKLQHSLKWDETGSAIDLGSLKIVSGKCCWVLTIDGLVMSSDGNVLDALSIATKAALVDLKIPSIQVNMTDEGEEPELDLDDDPEVASSLDTSRVPIFVTVRQAGGVNVVDLTAEEEACCKGTGLHVAVTLKGAVCHVNKAGESATPMHQILELVEVAKKMGLQLHKVVDRSLRDR